MSSHSSQSFRPGREPLYVETGSGRYPIYSGERLLAHTGQLLHDVCECTRLLIVTDSNVGPLYLETVEQSLADAGFEYSVMVIPAGEDSKSTAVLTELYNACSEAGISRRDGLVALGGGVVGDLTGYAAATWLRGVSYFQIPTTLLAQVDSSVGGKTGIDLPQGKNLVGAFKQPKAVIADIETLNTLPRRELAAGMAEVIKYALIRDPELWDLLREAEPGMPDAELIERCMRIKAEIVAEDEYDHGLRQILNFGHTYGHAIEKAQGYQDWRHGEAVACGMMMSLRLSELLIKTDPAIRADLEHLLKRWNLPTTTTLSSETLNDALRSDKKIAADTLDEILITEVGTTHIQRIPLTEIDMLTPRIMNFTEDQPEEGNTSDALRFVGPGALTGNVRPPWSKSQLHRLLIAAFLTGEDDWEQLVWPDLTADEEDRFSDDIQFTRQALHAMQDWLNASRDAHSKDLPPAQIECGESGTTLRLLLSIAAGLGIDAIFSGQGRLAERPLSELADQLIKNGATVEYLSDEKGHHLPLRISGQLTAGEYELPGHISSQYISGLLFALAGLDGPSVIRLTTPLASVSYVELTKDVCSAYGIHYEESLSPEGCEIYHIPGNADYVAPDTVIPPEADYSQAAFWLVAQDLGSDIQVIGLNPDSTQGDKAVVEILDAFKARRTDAGDTFEDLEIDISHVPDIVPVLTLSAARTPGTIRLKGASRLRIKESDRLEASLMILRAVGANQAYAEDDYLIIPDNLQAFDTETTPIMSCLGDHRIAMALSIAAVHSNHGLTLEGSHCVAKSYPDFFDELDRLKLTEDD